MEEYRIFLMEQQGWYITQSNNLQYDNWITSAPLGRCRGIINTIFSNEKEKIKLFPPLIILKFTPLPTLHLEFLEW